MHDIHHTSNFNSNIDKLETGPEITFPANSFQLGTIGLGEYKDTTIIIRNSGVDTLRISSITSSHGSFTIRDTEITIAPWKAFSDTVRFTAATIGTVTASIAVNSNASSSPDTVWITGTGGTVGVETDPSQQIPKEYSVDQNFPNPFNSRTTIRYGLPVRSYVKLELYNMLGQRVSTLVDGEQDARYYTLSWERAISSGIFFYRFIAVAANDPSRKYMNVRKMVLIK
jgi:hypothetical protein